MYFYEKYDSYSMMMNNYYDKLEKNLRLNHKMITITSKIKINYKSHVHNKAKIQRILFKSNKMSRISKIQKNGKIKVNQTQMKKIN